MCGLCGEVTFDERPVEVDGVVAMRDQFPHRGPDAAGVYVSPSARAGLGFRRLKIIDLSDVANQPMPNEDGSVHVMLNGEIYNFADLRRSLEARHHFRSRSDTEVIVHLYEELGADCIERLDGMFAIAIWDERQQRLILARDRAGKKPLYYVQTPRRLWFASEIKAFFVRPDVPIAIDETAIPYYLLHGYAPCPGSMYRGVRQVPPGAVVTADRDGGLVSRTYWHLEFPERGSPPPEGGSREAIRDRVRALTTDAVARRLTSDVPLGAFLSGGVDSTIVVGLMSQLLDRPVKTFSIGFKDTPAYDETRFARIASERFRTEHTEFIVEPGAFDLIDALVWHHDGPFGDSSAVPTYLVSKLTRQQVTVVLTGDGGDELFAGYLRFAAAAAAERTPAPLRALMRALAGALPGGTTARSLRSRVKRFADAASLPLGERITRWSSLFYDDLEGLLRPDLLATAAPINRLRYLERLDGRLEGRSTLSQLLAINFSTYLLDDLLIKTDRCTMANSLEARSPFLDTALMEYAARVPDGLKLSRGQTKIILREAFQDLVPDQIQRRGKMGFGIPFGLWFRGALREPLRDHLLAPDARYGEYLSTAVVHELVRKHDAGEADLGLPLWTLLTFEIWLRAWPTWRRGVSAGAGAVA